MLVDVSIKSEYDSGAAAPVPQLGGLPVGAGVKLSKESSSTGNVYEARAEMLRTGAKIGLPFTVSFDASFGIRATYGAKKMTERIEISRVDIKPYQVMIWALTLLCMVPLTLAMFCNFTLNFFLVFAMGCIANFIVQYANLKVWNIWYENGNIILNNIYTTRIKSVNDFARVELTSIFNNSYTIFFADSEKYNFRIKVSEDLRLLFKKNDQYYASQLNDKLRQIKKLLHLEACN